MRHSAATVRDLPASEPVPNTINALAAIESLKSQKRQIPPALAAWSFSFSLKTDYRIPKIPPASAAWSFNFSLKTGLQNSQDTTALEVVSPHEVKCRFIAKN